MYPYQARAVDSSGFEVPSAIVALAASSLKKPLATVEGSYWKAKTIVNASRLF